MIYWAQLFHFYQPPTQIPLVLQKICSESYKPLLKVFESNPHTKVTINVNGGLLEMLNDSGHADILESLRLLGEKGEVEFTGSSKYHAILPLLPASERKWQIELYFSARVCFLGKAYSPKGFFPAKMCYSQDILPEITASYDIKQFYQEPARIYFPSILRVSVLNLSKSYSDPFIQVLNRFVAPPIKRASFISSSVAPLALAASVWKKIQ